MTILFTIAIAVAVLSLVVLIVSAGLTTKPCARCHVEGGRRWIKERKVGNRLVREEVCDECSTAIFFSRRGVDWEPLPESESE